MPLFNVTTREAKEVWKSPDGQRTLFEVTLDYKGQLLKAKTYSGAIGTVGWAGEVETREETGKRGLETFVKQPAKEGSYGGGGSKPSYQPRDDRHIQAQWAIGQAIILLGDDALGKLDDIESLASDLFVMVNRVKNSDAEDTVAPVADVPTDQSLVDTIFKEPQTTLDVETETPWPTPKQ